MTDANVTPPPVPHQPPPPSPHAQPPLPVMAYATQELSNQAAVLSLVFGLMFFIPFLAPGIVAILFGRRGLKAAREQAAGGAGLARLGIVLGVVNIVFSVIVVSALPPALMQARRQAQQVACASNLRSIAQATMMYAAQNKGYFPPSIDHLAVVFGGPAGQVFTCPACAGNPAKPPVLIGKTTVSHYHILAPASRITQVKQPDKVVLAYEPPTHHDNRGMNVAFCDGHVEFIGAPAATQIAAELAAGQNPPPSHK